MNSPFVCEGCGKPRSYINQYCPNCESTGPHIPRSQAGGRKPSVSKKPEWRSRPVSDYETPERKKRPAAERKPSISSTSDEDRDIRSLYARKPSKQKISKSVWKNAGVVLVSLIVLGLVFVSKDAIVECIGKVCQTINSWQVPVENKTVAVAVQTPASGNQTPAINIIPKPVNPATVPVVTHNTDNQTPAVAVENTTASQAAPAVQNQPAAAENQTLRITDGPSYNSSDSSVTISWKTNINSSSFVKYGTDVSLPFPSTQVLQQTLDHSIYINGLSANTRYHYKVFSTDAAGDTVSNLDDRTFTTQPVTNTAPYSGSVAPDFQLKDLQNEYVSLSQFRGKKVILNFWASWCTPCKIELPHLQTVWTKYSSGSDVMVLTVAGSESDESIIRAFMAQNNFNFTVLLDSDDNVFNEYGITSIPKTYFIDKNGVIHNIQQGMFTSPGEIEFMLDSIQ